VNYGTSINRLAYRKELAGICDHTFSKIGQKHISMCEIQERILFFFESMISEIPKDTLSLPYNPYLCVSNCQKDCIYARKFFG